MLHASGTVRRAGARIDFVGPAARQLDQSVEADARACGRWAGRVLRGPTGRSIVHQWGRRGAEGACGRRPRLPLVPF